MCSVVHPEEVLAEVLAGGVAGRGDVVRVDLLVPRADNDALIGSNNADTSRGLNARADSANVSRENECMSESVICQ